MRVIPIVVASSLGLLAPMLQAATPSGGSVSESNATTAWSGPTPPVANPAGSTCSSPTDSACDNFQLTIAPPARAFDVKITIASNSSSPNDCYYLSVFDPTGQKIIGPTLDNASSAIAILHGPAAGIYTVSVATANDTAAVQATCSGAAQAYNATAVIPPPPPSSQLGNGPRMIGPPVVVGTAGNEPQITAAPDGKTLYIGALQHLYVSTNNGQTWAPAPGMPVYDTTANGNSDSSTDIDANGRMYFSFDYPYAGQVAVCASDDKGQTATCDAGASPGPNDRMWVVTPSVGDVYLTTNAGLYKTVFYGSTDSGSTFTPEKTVDVTSLEVTIGPMRTNPKDHRLYQPVDSGGGLSVLIWDPNTSNTGPEAKIPTGLGSTNELMGLGITRDGTMYVASDGGHQVNVASSADLGKTWTSLGPVPTTTDGTSVFSWIAAGETPGHIGVIYYHTASTTVDANTVWDAYWAETWGADRPNPTWFVEKIDQAVHTGNICSAISCSGNDRFAGDFISATFGADEVPHLAWMAQHTDSTGTLVTEVRSAGGMVPHDRIFGDLNDGFGSKP